MPYRKRRLYGLIIVASAASGLDYLILRHSYNYATIALSLIIIIASISLYDFYFLRKYRQNK